MSLTGHTFAIAVAQFARGSDKAANLASIRYLATTAVARVATLVVFPEYSSFLHSGAWRAVRSRRRTAQQPFVVGLEAIAKVLGIHNQGCFT
ncbi:MAG: hypothetical protein ACYCZY_11435 [Lacisediminihabitans sp.]